jgi:hypothetical protein
MKVVDCRKTLTFAMSTTANASTDAAKGEDAPANAVNIAKAKKDPPPEKPEQIRMRSFVLLSFWAIVVFLGLPIWWKTTTIYRANLPLDQMMDWADGKVNIQPFIYFTRTDNWNRRVALSSHFRYPYKQIHYKIMKPNTFCGQPSMP